MTTPAEDPRGGMGRHRAPPPPAKPPDRWLPHIAVAAVLLTAASLIAIYATGIAPDATAAGRHGLTVSTAARSARTVHVPLTVLPVPVPVIGAEGAWDPETTPNIALGRPVPSETFAGVTGTGTTSEAPSEPLVATTDPLTPDQQPATEPDTDEDPPPSPTTDTAAEPDEDSSDPTEETTPVTETVEPTEPTATVDVTAEVTVP